MSNSITIAPVSADSFTMARTSKSGKISTRNLLGLIIEGTPAEREVAGTELAKAAWDNGKLLIVVDTLARVFAGRTWDMSVAFCKLDATNPDKPTMLALMDALVRFHTDAKGIKGKYVTLCTQLVSWSKEEAARKEARKLAYEAELATS